jgi:hypothetical protein
VRILSKTKSQDALATLLKFLPLADSPQLVKLIEDAAQLNADSDGKPNELLVAALKSDNDALRYIAAMALTSAGTPEKPVRFESLQPQLIEMAKSDKSNTLRFELARLLLINSREKQAIGFLIETLPESTRGQSWVIEDLLQQVAKDDTPKLRCRHIRSTQNVDTSSNKAYRTKVRDAWAAWWKDAEAKVDLAKLELKSNLIGELVVVEMNWQNGQNMIVTEFGRDDKIKNQYSFVDNSGFSDMILLPNGNSLTANGSGPQIIERLPDGTEHTTHNLELPFKQNKNGVNMSFSIKSLQLLKNGHLFVAHQNGVAEYDQKFKLVASHNRPLNGGNPPYDVLGATKLGGGVTAISLNTGQILLLDDAMKESDKLKPIQGNSGSYRLNISPSSDTTFIHCENSQIIEYDVTTGKATQLKVPNIYSASSAQKLPNGNVIYVDMNTYPQRVVELDGTGVETFTYNMGNTNGNIMKVIVR